MVVACGALIVTIRAGSGGCVIVAVGPGTVCRTVTVGPGTVTAAQGPEAAGSAIACEVPGRLSLLVDAMFIMAYVYAAFRAYKYVKFLTRQSLLNRESWQGIAAIGSWLVFGAAGLDVVEDVRLWSEFGASTGACADLSTGLWTAARIGHWTTARMSASWSVVVKVRRRPICSIVALPVVPSDSPSIALC